MGYLRKNVKAKELRHTMMTLLWNRIQYKRVLAVAGMSAMLGWLSCSDYLGSGTQPSLEKRGESVAQEQAPQREKPSTERPVVEKKESVSGEETGAEPALGDRESGDAAGDAGEVVVEQSPKEEVKEEPKESEPVQVRRCGVSIRVTAGQFSRSRCDRDIPSPITSIAVAGEFNQWKPGAAGSSLQNNGGVWAGSIQAKAGFYAYKYVLNGQVWCRDPQNPKQKYDKNILNSLLEVPDCRLPLVRLEKLNAPANSGKIEADLRYLDGADKKGFDTQGVLITMNGQPLTKGVRVDGSGRISLRLTGLVPNRYSFRVIAKDKAGQKSKEVFFFAWVEKETFSWRDATLYFVFVDRFFNGDKSNDSPIQGVGAIANYQGGDLQGVIAKLKSGYFKKLSVNALWLSPLYEHPNRAEKGSDGRKYTGYHGYWPTEPRKVAVRLGSMKLLTQLVREAHKQGIRVLVDLAANHVHKDHPYWKQFQQSNWFHPFSPCAPAWDKPIVCWFDSFLPDLDYRNFAVAKQMTDDAVFWAQTAELDGFRVDAVKHMRQIVLFNLRAALRERVTHGHYHFYLVGETFAGGWKGGGDLIKGFLSNQLLSGQFDFPMYWELLGTIGRRDNGFNFQRLDKVVKESIDTRFYGTQSVMSRFLGNHDVPRFVSHANGQIASIWKGDREKAWQNPPAQPSSTEPYMRLRLAWTLLMALPGVPLIYYGDEIALAGEGDPDNRRMMPWSGLLSQQQSVLSHVQKVTAMRRQYPALRSLQRKTLFVDAERYAFLREAKTQKILVVLRRGGSTNTVAIPVAGLLADGKNVKDLLRGGSISAKNGVLSISLKANEGTYLLLP